MIRYFGCFFFLLFLPLFGFSFHADARSVYLNKVKIDAVFNQKIENCTVEIDANGDVWIYAKGYRVETGASSQPATTPEKATLQKQYFLVWNKGTKGFAPYDLDIWLNGFLVQQIFASRSDPVMHLDVTRYIRAGENQVQITSRKADGVPAVYQGEDAASYLTNLLIGEGTMLGRVLTIEQPVVTFKRSWSDNKVPSDVSKGSLEKFVFIAR